MIRFFIGFLFLICSLGSSAQTIDVHPLKAAPSLDGSGADWDAVPAVTVALAPLMEPSVVEAREVLVKAGYHGDRIYFYLEWVDSEEDLLHKPYVWDEEAGKYRRGPQREDRLALQFAIEGDYSTDWRRGEYFTADMWHWKSSRSNPIGLVHDKRTEVSSQKLLRAAKIAGHEGNVYVLRTNDAGTPIYFTQRYARKDQPVMPKYRLNPEVSGSIADIQAKGVWADGRWRLELSRQLDTGHDDDVVFRVGESVRGGIAVFDGSENEDHVISSTLEFRL